MASELRGAEDMGEDGKEKIYRRNPDPALARSQRRARLSATRVPIPTESRNHQKVFGINIYNEGA